MDLENFHSKNFNNFILRSDVPKDAVNVDVIIGIDEAGRGPVLGPMVYGACYLAKRNESLLTTLKVADSKTLTEAERDACFENMQNGQDVFGWIAEILSPARISGSMLSRSKYNLNALSHDSAMLLVQLIIDMNIRVVAVYLDTVGDVGKYQAKLQERFPHIPEIVVSKRADSLFPVVSAASIVAKVCRDKALKEWRCNMTRDAAYGSGYPGDPVTKRFLQDYLHPVFGYSQLIRFSWSTATTALNTASMVSWEEVIEDEDALQNTSITSFFKKQTPQGAITKEVDNHRFFSQRNMKNVVQF